MIPWSPLARGVLAGNRTRAGEKRTTRSQHRPVHRLPLQRAGRLRRRRPRRRGRGRARASRRRRSRSAWLLHKPGVTAPIVGATKLGHLEDAIAAEQLELERRGDRSGSRSRTCRTPSSATNPGAARRAGVVSLIRRGCARRQRDLVSHPRRRRRCSPTSRSASGNGEHVALVGANGAGKTTLIRAIAGEVPVDEGSVHVDGELRVMQPAGRLARRGPHRARPAARALAAPRPRRAGTELDAAEAAPRRDPASGPAWRWRAPTQPGATPAAGTPRCSGTRARRSRCAQPLPTAAVAAPRRRSRAASRSGSRSRCCCARTPTCSCSTSPTTTSTSPGKQLARGRAARLPEDDAAHQPRPGAARRRGRQGRHPRGPHRVDARRLVRRPGTRRATRASPASTRSTGAASEERKRLEESLQRVPPPRARWAATSSRRRVRATKSKIERFEATAPTDRVQRRSRCRCGSAATAPASASSICEQLELHGLTDPFDVEVWFGERIAVLGPNGTGQEPLPPPARGGAGRRTTARGASARASCPATSRRPTSSPSSRGVAVLDVVMTRRHRPGQGDGDAAALRVARLRDRSRSRRCRAVSRPGFQILLLELSGANLLLLDEPTDNLDLVSAEALEEALDSFVGTVVAVTHDRWFLRRFDRFLIFGRDCSVREHLEPRLRLTANAPRGPMLDTSRSVVRDSARRGHDGGKRDEVRASRSAEVRLGGRRSCWSSLLVDVVHDADDRRDRDRERRDAGPQQPHARDRSTPRAT